jgi:dienelactone hydrolase
MARWYGLAVVAWVVAGSCLGQAPDAGAAAQEIQDGNWVGHFALPVHAPWVQIDLQLYGSTAQVALGPGHAALQRASVRRSATTLEYALPGVPARLTFTLSHHGSALVGAVTQGALKGMARLARGKPTFTRFLGSYRTASNDLFITLDLSRLGLPPQLIDAANDAVRALYRTNATTEALGAGQALRDPVAGSIHFNADGSSLTESRPGMSAVQATRVPFAAQEVWFRHGNTRLAGTLLLPEGAGPFAAVVMAHGAGPSLRDEGQAFSNFLAARGIASLTMDKRGEGESGGVYLGDFAGERAVAGYAADVVAGGRFLARQAGIDPHRIGLFGGSQAGWIIPRAAAQSRNLFSFAVILSGPVVTQGESDYYASLCNQGNATPSSTPDQIDAAVRAAGPSGVDPGPDLRQLHIPVFWVYGLLDQNQPTRLDIPILEQLKAATGADFTWVVFPFANHGLVDTKTGLNSEAAASPNFAHGLFGALVTWLHVHSLGK